MASGLDREHVYDEPERTRRSTTRVIAVREIGRDIELHPASDFDPDQTLIPTLDYPADANRRRVCLRP